MRRLRANAVVMAGLLVPLWLNAQPRGAAPRSSFSGSVRSYRSYPAAPRTRTGARQARPATSNLRSWTPGFALPAAGSGQSLIGSGEQACLLNASYAGSFFCQQFFAGRASLGFEPYVMPYWFPSTGYETDQPAPPPPVEPDNQVAAQVGNLAAEVEMMREEQALRDYQMAAPPAQPAAEEKPPSTFFIYRDGRQLEVQNYAIVGNTLWVFSDQSTRRIPLADLNLIATRQFNEDRGVDFPLPDSH